MNDSRRIEEWRALCALASHETDPEKLMDLVERINTALDNQNRPSEKQWKMDSRAA